MVREPIQQRGQRPLSPHAPRSSRSYAVLAALSSCYPPLLGRLPTCYSPVRRCTKPRRAVLARLACVKHAASVRSEPGSNSPVEKLDPSSEPKLAIWFSKWTQKYSDFVPKDSIEGPERLYLLSSFQGAKSLRSFCLSVVSASRRYVRSGEAHDMDGKQVVNAFLARWPEVLLRC
jgi:hypothetical protein